jgi:SGNH domain (fused to AT3 domains)
VFGDSIAWTLVNYLPAHPGVTVRDHTMMGCGLLVSGSYRYFGTVHTPPAQCARWPDLVHGSVAADDPDVVMILFGRWETMDWSRDGRWEHLGQPAFDRHLSGELDRAAGLAGARGAAVVLATEPYNHRGERPDGGTWPEDDPGRVDRWNELLRQVAARRQPPAHVLDLGRRLCPDGRFTWHVDGVQVRSDGVHLTPDGVRWLSDWLFARLAAAR